MARGGHRWKSSASVNSTELAYRHSGCIDNTTGCEKTRAGKAHPSKPKSARFDWSDGSTRILVGFTSKGDARSTVALAHERLPDADEADRMKAFWRERVAALKELLER